MLPFPRIHCIVGSTFAVPGIPFSEDESILPFVIECINNINAFKKRI